MSTFLRTLALTAIAVGAIACVPQDGGYNGNSGYGNSGYGNGGGYQTGQRDRNANSCRRANNGECDEGQYGGSNRCDDGTDTNDCRRYTGRDQDRDRGNTCRRANNGVCDEGQYGGTNRCDDGTDTADCRGGQQGGYSRRNTNDDQPFGNLFGN
ncbi:hypothetical protein [Inquilinus sp.]|uniref:hypothetical protein n=1 Tax=Inquilinus sp. TaxID=1932117 RepID=UPI003784A5F9